MKPVEFNRSLWEPIRALPSKQRAKLEIETHHLFNVTNARIRNTDPKYTEQLEKAEKEAWYEFSQLCEQYGATGL